MIGLHHTRPIVNFCLKCSKQKLMPICGLAFVENNVISKHIVPNSRLVHEFLQKQHFSVITSSSKEESEQRDDDSSVKYVVSQKDFKWVRRVLPPSVIPEPPKHDKYPTPSGWSPPSETVPDLPYYIPRTRYHLIPVYVKREKNTGRILTKVENVEGDIWALEKDLIELIRPLLIYDPATRVHEVTRSVFIKGDHEDIVKDFLLEKGF